MKKLSSILLVIILFFCFITTRAQTSLALGDIAIIGVNSDGDDEFSFLLLRDITAGTSIYITDKGWNDGTGFYTVLGDGRWQWSTSSALSAGTIVNIKTTNNGVIEAGSLVATPGTVSWAENNGTVLSYAGDQVFLYQGTEASPTLITGCSWNVESSSSDSNWDGSATSTMTSALPNQLTNGVNAIWLHASGPTEKDNFRYNCSVTTGSADVLRSAINNLSNWSVDDLNTTPYTIYPFPCGFTVSPPCSEPDIPSLSANHSSVCSGSQSTISINGDLNDATQWRVYTSSCGGTLIGSTASSSFSVSPSATTTYYIRGEGGCATPGSCATITITVKPSYNLTESVSVCSGESYTFPDGTIESGITAQVVHTSNLLSVFSCDSIIETTVNVKPSYNLSESVMVCPGDNYTFPDGTVENDITAQVIHTSNLVTVLSCDSIIETTVNVKPSYNLSESVMVCPGDNYTFPDGTVENDITAQVIHTSNLVTVLSCDSIIETTVNVKPSYDLSESVMVCPGDNYTFPDGTVENDITAQVIHTSNLVTALSCDSIIETTVNVKPSYDLSESVVVCSGESYTFPDGTVENDITAQVIHTSNLVTVLSCDSIIETTVNVKPAFLEQETRSVCDGESVEWRGETYGTTGVYTETYTSVINGCDSVYQLVLTVKPAYEFVSVESVCSGASFEWRGNLYAEEGTYTESYSSVSGCDSVYTLELVVNPLPQIFDVTGGGEYNTGGEGVAIGLSNSETGVSYTLVLDGSVAITTESGTGNALDFGNQAMEGSYTVIAENAVTGCNAAMNGSVEVTIITSTRETLENNLSVFPNPTDGAVTIEGENIISVSVTDMSGKLVMEQFVNGNSVHLDLSGYTKSVYLVRVKTKGGTHIEKIIVE